MVLSLRVMICEDEAAEQEHLAGLLKKSSVPLEISFFSDGKDLLNAYFPGCCDLVLLDIFMSEIGGVETASRIRSIDPDVPIAFLTSSPDYTMEGFRCRVDRYLLKPVKAPELSELLRLAERKKQNQPQITLMVQGRSQQIIQGEISFAEQHAHAVFLHMRNGESLKTIMKLSELAAMLPSPPFYQFHKSYLVNLTQVRYLDNELKAFVMDGGCAYIRRDSLKEAREIYSRFMFDQVRRQEES